MNYFSLSTIKSERNDVFYSFLNTLNKCIHVEEIEEVLNSYIFSLLKVSAIKFCFNYQGKYWTSHQVRDVDASGLNLKDKQAEGKVFAGGKFIYCRNKADILRFNIPFFGIDSLDSPFKAILSLPLSAFKDVQMVITVGYIHEYPELDEDFNFLKLIADTLCNKLHQFFLIDSLEHQHQQMKVQNAQIKVLKEELESRIEQRTEDLNNINKELKTLFYHTSHDFRAPLTNIHGVVNLLKETQDGSQMLDLLGYIELSVKGLYRMLYKLNALSSLEIHENEEINLPNFITELKAQLEEVSKTKKVNLQLIDYIQKPLIFSRFLLSVIMENLIENSIKYSHHVANIKASLSLSNHHLTIIVKDDGEGISDQIKDHIFTMYYRGNVKSDGNGLGLYLIKKIIEYKKGSIGYENLNPGTQFKITIPYHS
ncbi:sensor histidine kinase [Pedobacter glucosidilyticus]|uniref:sensor histidine kinase n=1 Tax=Pedobacter glucosidilyticus TaxID=1122941 RepID=UPI000428A40D|nr:HAMP domain-containing sensor histidine kinase [Pedobacter glucosidilyticus]